MKHPSACSLSLAVAAALVCFSPVVHAQYTCTAPGIAGTPLVNAWAPFPGFPVSVTAMKRVADGSWTSAEYDTSNPLSIVTTTPNFQNLVAACAPPGSGRTGSGKVTGAVSPAVASQRVALGDLDGSGNASIAALNPNVSPSGVTVYIGSSSFMPVSVKTFATGSQPAGVVIADLNNDGKPDIVVADFQVGQTQDGGDVAVLLNSGGGSFHDPVKYAAGNGPLSIAVGDVNGDGIPDIVTANVFDSTVSVLIGVGDGTFKPAVTYPVGEISPEGVILADFNGDGKLDIAVGVANPTTFSYSVSVLLNQGNGTFGAAQLSPSPQISIFLAAYDFDGDGKLDLAVNDAGGAEVGILHGNGDGTFVWSHTYGVDVNPASLIVTDFNNDGIADIVVASGDDGILGPDTGKGRISVLLGNGDGTFRGTTLYQTGGGPNSVAIADFKNDGHADLVVTNQYGSPFVELFSGKGDGTFASGASIPQFGAVSFVATADFNGDGNADLAATSTNGSVLVSLGDGHGGFAPTTSTSVAGSPAYLAVGDFNGDGKPDMLVAGASTGASAGAVSVLIGDGNGSFKTPTTPLTGVNAQVVATGDFNLDGNLDAAVVVGGSVGNNNVAGSLVTLTGKGDGTFAAQPAMKVGTTPVDPLFVAVGDVNGDGRPDLAVVYEDFNSAFFVQVFLGKGDGTFQALPPMTTESGAGSIVINDFNGDGRPDLVISHCCGGDMTYMLGNGDGTFKAETHFSGGAYPSGMAMGELNGDGVQDLVVADNLPQGEQGFVAILPGAGLRTQSAASFAFLPLAPNSIVATFGHGVATGTLAGVTAASLLGTTVNVQDSAGVSRPATLTFVSPHQVNYIVPDGTANGLAKATVLSGDGTSIATQYYVSGAAPGIFAINGGGLIAADVLRVHKDGTAVSENIYSVVNNQVVALPLNLGVAAGDKVFLEIFGTGFRSVSQANVQVTIGGVSAPVTFVGAQESPGLDQLNVQVPASLAGRGNVTVVMTAGSQVANLTNFVIQ